MKKIILIIIAIAYYAGNGNAQEAGVQSRLLFGMKGGLNSSDVYDTQGENFYTKPKLGLAGGFFLAIPFGKYLGIQPEVLLSQKGFKATGEAYGSSYSFTRTTSYIDMPLFCSFKPSEFLTMMAGPQLAYLLHQRDRFSNSALTIENQDEFRNNKVRKNTLGFTGGIDINLNHLVLGARAGWDVQKNYGDGSATNPRYKNLWYQATIGYQFYN